MARVLAQLQPRRLLCLGRRYRSLLGEYAAGKPERSLQFLEYDPAHDRLDRLGRFDLIVIADTLERLNRSEAEHLLSRLRDLHGGRLLLRVRLGPHPNQTSRWKPGDLLALGMREMAGRPAAGDCRLYFFDLYDDKPVPEWLNARFWANPERWDKEFW